MVVYRGDFNTILDQPLHDRADFSVRQYEIPIEQGAGSHRLESDPAAHGQRGLAGRSHGIRVVG